MGYSKMEKTENSNIKGSSGHKDYFDILSIVGAFCVILLHCNGIFHQYSDTLVWKEAWIVNTLAIFAVPIFFMISGATLMEYRKRYSTETFFKKRFLRTVIPFVAWCIIFVFIRLYTGYFDKSIFKFSELMNIFSFQWMENTYWFFPILFGIYLSMPILSLLINNRKVLWYSAFVAFVTVSVLPVVFPLINCRYNANFTPPMLTGYIIFPILGYLIATQDITKNQRKWIYAAGALMVAVRLVGIYYLAPKQDDVYESFSDYLAFHTIIFATAIFVFAKYINWEWIKKIKPINWFVKNARSCSLGIYLVHRAVIGLINYFVGINESSLMWRTLGAVGVFGVSFLIILVMKKIPLVKYIVP